MADLPLQVLTEIRDEAREFRAETRETLAGQGHRLGLVEADSKATRADIAGVRERLGSVEGRLGSVEGRLGSIEGRFTSLERHMAALLSVVPVMNERMDRFEARLAALEQQAGG